MIKRPEYDLKQTGEQIRKLRRERNISVDQIREYMKICCFMKLKAEKMNRNDIFEYTIKI